MTEMPLMIFAAGFGTRMGALTRDRPKPLIEVAGKPLIGHALDMARDAGIRHCVANTHYLYERLEPWLEAEGVTVSREWPAIRDTGGGLRQALPLLGDGPVMTLNPDAVWTGPNPLGALQHVWQGGQMGALLMLVPVTRALGRQGGGDFSMDEDGRLRRGGDLLYAGAQILDPAGLDGIGERVFSLNRVWDDLAQRGELFGTLHQGDWCDVGQPGGIALAESMLREASDV